MRLILQFKTIYKISSSKCTLSFHIKMYLQAFVSVIYHFYHSFIIIKSIFFSWKIIKVTSCNCLLKFFNCKIPTFFIAIIIPAFFIAPCYGDSQVMNTSKIILLTEFIQWYWFWVSLITPYSKCYTNLLLLKHFFFIHRIILQK